MGDLTMQAAIGQKEKTNRFETCRSEEQFNVLEDFSFNAIVSQ